MDDYKKSAINDKMEKKNKIREIEIEKCEGNTY